MSTLIFQTESKGISGNYTPVNLSSILNNTPD